MGKSLDPQRIDPAWPEVAEGEHPLSELHAPVQAVFPTDDGQNAIVLHQSLSSANSTAHTRSCSITSGSTAVFERTRHLRACLRKEFESCIRSPPVDC